MESSGVAFATEEGPQTIANSRRRRPAWPLAADGHRSKKRRGISNLTRYESTATLGGPASVRPPKAHLVTAELAWSDSPGTAAGNAIPGVWPTNDTTFPRSSRALGQALGQSFVSPSIGTFEESGPVPTQRFDADAYAALGPGSNVARESASAYALSQYAGQLNPHYSASPTIPLPLPDSSGAAGARYHKTPVVSLRRGPGSKDLPVRSSQASPHASPPHSPGRLLYHAQFHSPDRGLSFSDYPSSTLDHPPFSGSLLPAGHSAYSASPDLDADNYASASYTDPHLSTETRDDYCVQPPTLSRQTPFAFPSDTPCAPSLRGSANLNLSTPASDRYLPSYVDPTLQALSPSRAVPDWLNPSQQPYGGTENLTGLNSECHPRGPGVSAQLVSSQYPTSATDRAAPTFVPEMGVEEIIDERGIGGSSSQQLTVHRSFAAAELRTQEQPQGHVDSPSQEFSAHSLRINLELPRLREARAVPSIVQSARRTSSGPFNTYAVADIASVPGPSTTDRPRCLSPATDTPGVRQLELKGLLKSDEYGGKKARRRFEEAERKRTSETRRWGSCIRCKAQRKRCHPSWDEPENPEAACSSCLAVNWESRKVTHRDVHCYRWKLTAITLFRSPGARLTQRWPTDTHMHDVGDWADDVLHEVHMDQGLCNVPVVLWVRKFRPVQGDVLGRQYAAGQTMRLVELPPYALADIAATADVFKRYISDNAVDGVERMTSPRAQTHPIIRKTFRMALDHYHSLSAEEDSDQKALLWNAIKLWFAVRHMTGSSWVSHGQEKLGYRPVTDPECPARLRDKHSLPRMIVDQFDRIQYFILKPLVGNVLPKLEKMCYSSNPANWFTVYIVTFLFLYQTSHTSADRRGHARNNNQSAPYSLGSFIEQLQFGATVLIVHFRYYKQDVEMSKLTMEVLNSKSFASTRLSEGQKAYLVWVSKQLKSNKVKTEVEDAWANLNWDHDLYFVAQMFEPKWSPHESFKET